MGDGPSADLQGMVVQLADLIINSACGCHRYGGSHYSMAWRGVKDIHGQ
jgi:hypothetical protein